jgi:hypothetical protein
VTQSFSERRLTTTILSGALAALVLSGCNKSQTAAPAAANTATAAAAPADVPTPSDALPLTDTSSAPLATAPSAAALPTAPPVRVAYLRDPRQGYAYLDKATAMRHAFGDAPPDYTYDYQGVRPWVWRSADHAAQLVEPLSEGNRSYYFQPGAALPYLISDGQNSYGYDDGALVVVYDNRGRPLPPPQIAGKAGLAARYLQRAQDIYMASMRAQRMAVARDHWFARRQAWAAEQARWEQAQEDDAEWRAYHAQYAQDENARWAAERYQREAEAARMADAMHDQAAAQIAWQAALAARDRGPPPGAMAGGGGRNDRRGAPPPLASAPMTQPPNPQNFGRPPTPTGPWPQQRQAVANAQAAANIATADAARKAQVAEQAQAQAAAQQQAAAQAQARQQALAGQIDRERAQAQGPARQQALAHQVAQQQAQQQALAAQAQRQRLAGEQAQARAQAQAAAQASAQARAQAQAAAAAHAQAAAQARTQAESVAAAHAQAAAQARAQAAQVHAQAAQAHAQAAQAHAQAISPHPPAAPQVIHPQPKEPTHNQAQPPPGAPVAAKTKAEAPKKKQEPEKGPGVPRQP